MIRDIDVHALLRASSAAGYTDLVTRPTGRVVRESIEREMAAEASVAFVARMDFSGVGCIDYSCADEIVAKLNRAERVLVLLGLSDAHRDTIEPVLAGHGLAVLLEHPDGTLETLGSAAAAHELLDRLVTWRLAGQRPGGAFALLDA